MDSGRIPELAIRCPVCGAALGDVLAPIRRNGAQGGEERKQWQLCRTCLCGVDVIVTAKRIPPGGYSVRLRSTGITIQDDLPF
jgi:hypothetical protein